MRYNVNKSDHAAQLQLFESAAKQASVDITYVDHHRLALYGQAIAFLSKWNAQKRIIVDLSSMASFVFYPLMCAICDSRPDAELILCYTEACDYFPSLDDWKHFQEKMQGVDLLEKARYFDEYHFQSRGVDHVYETANFPGQNIDNLPTTLVVIPNFSYERVQRMINYAAERYPVSRTSCEWVFGVPQDQTKYGWRLDALWELYDKPQKRYDSSTLNHKEMLLTLHQLWLVRHLSESIVIATVASKIQHLGTFMFLIMHPEVGLILSEPTEFMASRYSIDIGVKRYLEIGNVSNFISTLRSWNKITFNW